ncbi:hypothetical protein Q6346_03395 [Isoptericola sp. b490]|uniref:hypothetical protein n=1 Tax=Actinotalea lenta TaxID=3064654 RepID=UPI00271423E5|nr:hypothetical protein [Isoptericola sp. b490]MDO8120356.1 hypothetical protein [Isoptericola sp. b490]
MSRAQWRWEFVGARGRALDRPVSPVFTNRFDAEQWLGEHWRSLAHDVLAAQLLSGEDRVGREVPLREA